MVICTVEVNEKAPQTIVIGRRGTYNTQEVVFDIGYLIDAYGVGTAVLAVKRSQDSSAYPAVVAQEDSTVTWTVSETDTYYKGTGECELMWYVDGGLAKTVIYPIAIMRDIGETTEEPPDPYETWVDELTALGAETLENARNAAGSEVAAGQSKADAEAAARRAEESERNAKESEEHSVENADIAESWAVGGTGTRPGEDTNNSEFWSRMAQEAADNDGWVHFYIDDEGVLHYVKTENAALDFYIDVAGILHVTNA